MSNLLLEEIEYKVDTTSLGTWRRYMYPAGAVFSEFKSHSTILGFPLVHYTSGKCPETGRRIAAKGVIAVGRIACGFIAIGHLAIGVVAVGQAALGVLFGIGQAVIGTLAVGQLAVGISAGLGQFTTGYIAVGQLAFGKLVLAQKGYGAYVWSMDRSDTEALEFFGSFLQ